MEVHHGQLSLSQTVVSDLVNHAVAQVARWRAWRTHGWTPSPRLTSRSPCVGELVRRVDFAHVAGMVIVAAGMAEVGRLLPRASRDGRFVDEGAVECEWRDGGFMKISCNYGNESGAGRKGVGRCAVWCAFSLLQVKGRLSVARVMGPGAFCTARR